MTVMDILKQGLKDNGYDGLVADHGECGCKLDNLAPCGESPMCCLPGYVGPPMPDANDYDEIEFCVYAMKDDADRARKLAAEGEREKENGSEIDAEHMETANERHRDVATEIVGPPAAGDDTNCRRKGLTDDAVIRTIGRGL